MPHRESTSAPATPAAAVGSPLALHGGLLAVQLLFSSFHVSAKFALAEIDPLALACLRVLFVTPVLVALAWRHDRKLPALRDLPWLALLGALGVFGNQVLFITGLSHTTATNAAILMPAIPVFAAAIGALFGIDRVGPRRLLGIGLAVAGALAVLDPTHFSMADEQTLGNLLVLSNTFLYAGFLVLQRPVLERLPWRTVIAGSFAFGSIGVLAMGGGELAAVDAGAVSAAVWWAVGVALLATLGGYALNTWAVRRSSPTLVAAYTTLQPLTSAGLAALLLGESMGAHAALGLVLIAGGLWLVSRPRRVSRD